MYGKIKGGYLEPAPRQFNENGNVTIGFTDDFLRRHGYKPVVFSNPPDDNKDYMEVYEEDKNNIYQKWIVQ